MIRACVCGIVEPGSSKALRGLQYGRMFLDEALSLLSGKLLEASAECIYSGDCANFHGTFSYYKIFICPLRTSHLLEIGTNGGSRAVPVRPAINISTVVVPSAACARLEFCCSFSASCCSSCCNPFFYSYSLLLL